MPCDVATEPGTTVVFVGIGSVKTTPVASVFPLFEMVTEYDRVSPGVTSPLPSASTSRVSVFDASMIGSAVIGVSVGSSGAGVSGSSVGMSPWLLDDTVPWFET